MNGLCIEDLDRVKEVVRHQVREALRMPNTTYADLRVELGEGIGVASEDGNPRGMSRDFGFSLGVRVIVNHPISASGEEGQVLGVSDFNHFKRVLKKALLVAHARASAKARGKEAFIMKWGNLAYNVHPTALAPIPVTQINIVGALKTDPRTVNTKTLLEHVTDISKEAHSCFPRLTRSVVTASSSLERKLFVSSEGACIDTTYAYTGGFPFYVALADGHPPFDIYCDFGNQVGLEAIFEGVNSYGATYRDFCLNLAKEANDLVIAPQLEPTEKPVVVVTDPDFNALVAHEIVAHPSELDRAMKWETGYAGRSWFMKTPKDTMVGQPIGSPLLNAFSDPTLTGAYGHYEYDDEGTPAKRVWHIKDGVFQNFLNSRQTAAMIGTEPNGHFLASDASVAPVIRMSVSSFAAGNRNPKDIIGEVEDGYYFVGHRIPAIGESRQNFRISGRLVRRIRGGELQELYRDGSITSDTKDFFMSIDAVGNDWKIFAIPNCGKGQPMQGKRVGNGGPTMRGLARLAGKAV